MQKIAFIALLLIHITVRAQMSVTMCQRCPENDVKVFYKSGIETAVATKLNDSCNLYTFAIKEPTLLFIHLTSKKPRYFEQLWADPAFPNRTVTIDNCTRTMYKLDSIPIDRDYEPYNKLQKDLALAHVGKDSSLKALGLLEAKYIETHPDSFLSIWYLARCMYHQDIGETKRLLALIKAHNSIYPSYREVESYVQNYSYKSVPMIGDTFWEFVGKKIDGENFDSRELSNKIIVMDFWYSGCGPCRKMIEPLKKLYTSYKNLPVEFISYSVDDNEKDWKTVSVLNNVPWINTSNLDGFNGFLPLHYSVQSFPTFIIFDQSKKISLITFGDELPLIESKIKELLGGK